MKSHTTDRLILRPWTLDDVEFVFDMYSRWEVQRFIGFSPRVLACRAEAEEKILHWQSLRHEINGFWAITSKESGALLGNVFLKPIPFSFKNNASCSPDDTEIGWHLYPKAWGKGFASESAAALLQHAFGEGLERVVAVTYPENIASVGVCERIGMRYEGLSSAYYNATVKLFTAMKPAL